MICIYGAKEIIDEYHKFLKDKNRDELNQKEINLNDFLN